MGSNQASFAADNNQATDEGAGNGREGKLMRKSVLTLQSLHELQEISLRHRLIHSAIISTAGATGIHLNEAAKQTGTSRNG